MSVPRAMLVSLVVVCLFAAGRILHEGVTLRQADEAGTRIQPDQDMPGKRLTVVAGILALGCAVVVALHWRQWAQAAALAIGGAGLFVALIVGIGYQRADWEVAPVYVWVGAAGLATAPPALALHWWLRPAKPVVAVAPDVPTPRIGPSE